jgi:Uma2 family endonuclease
MELTLNPDKRYNYADYLTWTDNKMRQLFDGIIHLMSPAPKRGHQKISINLSARLFHIIEKKRGHCEVYAAPFDVRLPKNNEKEDDKIFTVVQPDVCIVCDLSKLDERGCIGAPDFVAEIISLSSVIYDTNDKLKIYEEAGVKEYWIVFPDEGVQVFLLQDSGTYGKAVRYEKEEKIPVHILGGVKIKLF